MGTKFAQVYNRFLGKITDDMYVELTPEDTMRDMQHLLISAIPEFEFPRKRLDDYEIKMEIIDENGTEADDFVVGVTWDELSEEEDLIPEVIVDRSIFSCTLTSEEINILAQCKRVGVVYESNLDVLVPDYAKEAGDYLLVEIIHFLDENIVLEKVLETLGATDMKEISRENASCSVRILLGK